MKKLTQILAMAALAALPFAMTSCDDDPWHDDFYPGGDYPGGGNDNDNTFYDMAQALCNTWTGNVQLHEDGQDYYFYANMEFYQTGSNRSLSGSGIETDYATLEDGTTAQATYRFTWSIDQNTGDIYIRYNDTGTQYVLDYGSSQRGFSLSDTSFYGYMLGVTYPDDYIAFDFTNARNNAKRNAIGQTTTATSTLFGAQTVSVKPDTTLPQRLPKH